MCFTNILSLDLATEYKQNQLYIYICNQNINPNNSVYIYICACFVIMSPAATSISFGMSCAECTPCIKANLIFFHFQHEHVAKMSQKTSPDATQYTQRWGTSHSCCAHWPLVIALSCWERSVEHSHVSSMPVAGILSSCFASTELRKHSWKLKSTLYIYIYTHLSLSLYIYIYTYIYIYACIYVKQKYQSMISRPDTSPQHPLKAQQYLLSSNEVLSCCPSLVSHDSIWLWFYPVEFSSNQVVV